MKTRTLLLLAVATGLAILVAGGVQLIRVSTQDPTVPSSVLGTVVEVGDMDVVVREASMTSPAELVVDVELGGVEEADGADGFSLVVPGDVIAPDPSVCAVSTAERRPCTLAFDVSDAEGDARTLRYDRADEAARWPLP